MYFFDPYDSYFRDPSGAIEIPGMLRLRIKLRRGEVADVWVLWRADGAVPHKTPMEFAGVAGEYDIYICEIHFDNPGLYWYQFQVDFADASVIIPEHGEGFQVTAYKPHVVPGWVQGGVIYHIFVDRFRSGGVAYRKEGAVYRDDWGGTPHYLPNSEGIVQNNDFFGGDLYGIIEKLPYLKRLCVTCIYLSPVFEAASNHKYDTGDFRKIDPGFGGDEAFEKLCAEAKQYGISVILDGVFNHVGVDSRYFNKYGNYTGTGAYQCKDSPYYEWFNFHHWPNIYDAWWGIDLLPAINELNEAYRDFICGEDGVIAHWTKKGVAGWRLDVVDELPDAFLDPLCQAMKRANPKSYVVGEVWEDASNKVSYSVRRRYFQGGQLDSVTNYTLKDAIIDFVKNGDAPRLAAVMDSLKQNYPAHVLHALMNILGTHDTMRILTVLGSENFPETKQEMEHFHLSEAQLKAAKRKLKLAAALQFTLPGVPCIYYGDEAGMEGGADPFCRRCYPWGKEDEELIEWYTCLAELRREQNALKNGEYALKQAKTGIFAFIRGHGMERILVAINSTDRDIVLVEVGFNYDLLKKEYLEKMLIRGGETAIFAMKRPE